MIKVCVANVKELRLTVRESMFSLFEQYYSAVDFTSFNADLDEKDSILLLTSEDEAVIGFTTLKVMDFNLQGIPGRALFSGDTIIHHDYWGTQILAKAWCEYAGKLKSREPDLPLYWFLIVKGHKTYRYLPVFTRKFYPRSKVETPQPIQRIMDYLACQRFGNAYNQAEGLIQFNSSKGHLRAEWSDIPGRLDVNPHVDFFLKRNPGYRGGDELVCIAELSKDNMRFHARQAFLLGACETSATDEGTRTANL